MSQLNSGHFLGHGALIQDGTEKFGTNGHPKYFPNTIWSLSARKKKLGSVPPLNFAKFEIEERETHSQT